MTILVIAPSRQQFDYFLYSHQRVDDTLQAREFRYISNESEIDGFHGELIIVNAADCARELTDTAIAAHQNKQLRITYVTS